MTLPGSTALARIDKATLVCEAMMTQPIEMTKPKRPHLMAETGDSKGCLPFILLMFTLCIIYWGAVFYRVIIRPGNGFTPVYFHEEGIPIEARVIGKEVSRECGYGPCYDIYLIDYLFITRNEQQIIGKERVDRTHYEATPIGGGWPVVYLRSESTQPTKYESQYNATRFVKSRWREAYASFLIYFVLFIAHHSLPAQQSASFAPGGVIKSILRFTQFVLYRRNKVKHESG